MVEEGWKLLKPEEVVINLDNESDFKPYLYKLPLELGTFTNCSNCWELRTLFQQNNMLKFCVEFIEFQKASSLTQMK